jgi:hypothetical protein
MGEFLGLLLVIFILGFLYFIPSIVARDKENFVAIFVLNFFLGWTFWGWVAALVWACLKEKRVQSSTITIKPDSKTTP